MKASHLILGLLMTMSLCAPALATEAHLFAKPHMLNADLKNADLRQTLTMMAKKGGLEAVFDKDVTGKVSLDLKHVPLEAAFQQVLDLYHLTCEKEGTKLHIKKLGHE